MHFDYGDVLDVDEFFSYLLNLGAFEVTANRLFGAEILSFIHLQVHESCSSTYSSMVKVASPSLETRLSLGLRANLGDSLSAYFAPEQLTGDNQVRCDWCKNKFNATKQLRFASLPKVLILQLKRFEFNVSNMRNRKIDTPVPLTANITLNRDWFTQQLQAKVGEHLMSYHLFAIIIHRGNADPRTGTSEGAHYWTYAKDYEDPAGQWWRFDDEQVTGGMDAHVDTIISSGIDSYDRSGWPGVSTPYFLFYELDSESERALSGATAVAMLERLPGKIDHSLMLTQQVKLANVTSSVGFFQSIKNYTLKACRYISMLWRR
jgi:ubiquitin C-terminal hydrolase